VIGWQKKRAMGRSMHRSLVRRRLHARKVVVWTDGTKSNLDDSEEALIEWVAGWLRSP